MLFRVDKLLKAVGTYISVMTPKITEYSKKFFLQRNFTTKSTAAFGRLYRLAKRAHKIVVYTSSAAPSLASEFGWRSRRRRRRNRCAVDTMSTAAFAETHLSVSHINTYLRIETQQIVRNVQQIDRVGRYLSAPSTGIVARHGRRTLKLVWSTIACHWLHLVNPVHFSCEPQ